MSKPRDIALLGEYEIKIPPNLKGKTKIEHLVTEGITIAEEEGYELAAVVPKNGFIYIYVYEE